MKIKSALLNSTAVWAGARSWHANQRLTEREARESTLYQMPDGTLTFMNGSPVLASELTPGKRYKIIMRPADVL